MSVYKGHIWEVAIWIRANHPQLVLLGLGAIVLAGLVVCFSRCGRRPTVAAKAPAIAANKSGKPKKEWMDDCPEPKDWGREPDATSRELPPPPPAARAKPSSDGDAEKKAQPRKPPKPVRPSDVADWKREDYYSAKRDNDPRLTAAVACLGGRSQDKQAAAELLDQAAGIVGRRPGRGGPDESPADAKSETRRGPHCRAGGE